MSTKSIKAFSDFSPETRFILLQENMACNRPLADSANPSLLERIAAWFQRIGKEILLFLNKFSSGCKKSPCIVISHSPIPIKPVSKPEIPMQNQLAIRPIPKKANPLPSKKPDITSKKRILHIEVVKPERKKPAEKPRDIIAAPADPKKIQQWLDLPKVLVSKTVSFLDYTDLRSVSLACKQLQAVSNENSHWRDLYPIHFGRKLQGENCKEVFKNQLPFKNGALIRRIENCRARVSLYPNWNERYSMPRKLNADDFWFSFCDNFTTVGDLKNKLSAVSGIPVEKIGLRIQNFFGPNSFEWSNIENSDHDAKLLKSFFFNLGPIMGTAPEYGYRIGYYELD
jgi:hypothetical protein